MLPRRGHRKVHRGIVVLAGAVELERSGEHLRPGRGAQLGAVEHRHKVLDGGLESIAPVVLRRLAEQGPDRAGRVFARLLGKPRFAWQRDGEALLRRYKPGFFDRTPLPGVTPLSGRQREFLRP
jgi:hypothetical protein